MYKYFLIILFIFILFDYILKKNYENFDSSDITSDDIQENSSKIWKKFCGIKDKFNYNYKTYTNEQEEQIQLKDCAKENEKCLVDTKGNNTCCGDFSCVRLKNNFGYKVCSYKKDACGYLKDSYLRYLFNDDLWNSIYDKLKKFFQNKNKNKNQNNLVEEEDNILNNKRKEIVDKINKTDFCGARRTASQIKDELDKLFTKDQIFHDLIYGVKKVTTSTNNEDDQDDNRSRCSNQSTTLDNY